MTTQPVAEQQTHRDPAVKLLIALLVGGAVSVALGVYGNVHDPTREQPYTLFFTDTIQLKVWFATAVVVLAVVQVLLGDAPLRQDPRARATRRRGWATRHRLVGTIAFVLTLPVGLPVPLGARVPVHRHARARALAPRLRLLRRDFTVKVLAVRVHGLPEPDPAAGRRPRVRGARRDLAHEQRSGSSRRAPPASPLF